MESGADEALRWVAVGMAGLGGLLALIGLAILVWSLRFGARATATEGEVVGLRERGDGGGNPPLAPVVAFALPDGRPVQFTDKRSSYPPRYRAGDRVKVQYDQRDPQQARVAGRGRSLLVPMVLFGVAVLFFALAVGLNAIDVDDLEPDPPTSVGGGG